MIQVTGVLVDPLNQPSENTVIRVEALENGITLKGMQAKYQTSFNGDYDFTIVTGRHLIEINFDEEFKLTGEVIITDAMTGTYELPRLLIEAKPVP